MHKGTVDIKRTLLSRPVARMGTEFLNKESLDRKNIQLVVKY